MSHRAYDLVWNHSRTSGGAKLVLLSIAHFADKDTLIAFPGVATLARMTGFSERQVQRTLRKIEQLGELQVVQRGGFGRRSSTTYRIVITALETASQVPPSCDGKGDVDVTLNGASKGDISGPSRVTSKVPKGDISGPLGCHPCHPNRVEPRLTESEPSRTRELSQKKDSARFARWIEDHPEDELWCDLCRSLGLNEMRQNGAMWEKRLKENRPLVRDLLGDWNAKTEDQQQLGGGNAAAFMAKGYRSATNTLAI